MFTILEKKCTQIDLQSIIQTIKTETFGYDAKNQVYTPNSITKRILRLSKGFDMDNINEDEFKPG